MTESLLGEGTMQREEIERAYCRAAGVWTGCDWPMAFGKTGLNLGGLKASQALLLARATSGSERADWHAAVAWLMGVEREAREAEKETTKALDLARSGRLGEALVHAQRACAIEAKYHNQLVWRPLQEAIEAALDAATGVR